MWHLILVERSPRILVGVLQDCQPPLAAGPAIKAAVPRLDVLGAAVECLHNEVLNLIPEATALADTADTTHLTIRSEGRC